MQDIHSIVGGRIFGATTSGDRRLRPLHHHHHHSNHHHQQALKCPRCESLNTKFCYYNNYNLSQPRHFCKSCRRYWTKGGVLRNVPVGGGCRKNKRSKPKNNPSTPALSAGEPSHTTVPPLPAAEKLPHPAEPKSSPPSSSESSSVTGAEAAMPMSAPAPTSVSASEMLGMGELRSVVTTSADPSTCGPVFEHALLEQLGTAGDNNGIFTENNGDGGYTGMMMTSSWNEPFSVGSNGILLNQHNPWFHEDKLQGISSGFLDQTVENRSGEGNGGFGALDWHPSGGDNDQGLFDLPNAVDQAYWSHTQWTDQDNSNLYIP